MADIAVGDIIWNPPADIRQTSHLGQYMSWLEANRDLSFDDYQALWQWSVDDIDAFWRSIWDYFDIESSQPVGPTLGKRDMPGAEWFPGVGLNFGGEIVRKVQDRPDDIALIGVSQARDDVEVTNAELLDWIARIRVGLTTLGLTKGDRVVAYMPNIPETAAAWFACASLGIIWASAAPEFGPQAVIDRFGQLEPAALITIDGYTYGEKKIDVRDRVAAIRDGIPSITSTVSMNFNGHHVPDSIPWEDFVAETAPIEPEPVPFDYPLCVLFSSGTTGLPKAIVHSHGGIILETLKSSTLSWNLGIGDRLQFFSTTAWMMWNATIGSLLTGCSVVCLDGNPMYPDERAQWSLAAHTKATHIGLSPTYVMACAKSGMTPTTDFDLSNVRLTTAGGAPMPAEGHVWIVEQFGDDVPMILGSGGTDICSATVQGNVMVPVYAGEMSSKCLGVAAYAFDDDGNSVIGELGEMVITQPMPSMPVNFWGDDDMARYRSAYFEHYPGLMRFGDWIRFTPHGSSLITGRSDATLNRGGVRIGTAEIYRVVDQMPDIAGSLIVHLEDPGGMGELVLFVVPKDRDLDDAFRAEILSEVRTRLSPRHGPNTMVQVSDIPLNMTRKKLELPVKKILRGADPDTVVSREAMMNPDSLADFIAFAASRS